MHLRVQEIRQRRRLTQQQLATLAGCSREMISAIETARSQPTLDRLAAIALALDVPVQDLLDGALCPHATPRRPPC